MATLPLEPADRQALAIGASVRLLSAEPDGTSFVELLPFRKAWPLAVLIATWYLVRSRRDPDWTPSILDWKERTSGVRVIHNLFDTYQQLLEPAAKAAYEAKETWDYAGAGGLFALAAKTIKLPYLRAALANSAFEEAVAAISIAAPAPADLEYRYAAELGQPSQAPAAPAQSPAATLPRVLPPSSGIDTPSTMGHGPTAAAPDQAEVDMCSIYLRGQLGITSDSTISKLCAGPAKVPFLIIAGLNVHEAMERDFRRFVLGAPEIQRELEKFITISYDVAEDRDPLAFRSLKITAFPTFVVSLRQQERGRLVGYASHDRFVEWLASLQISASDRINPQVNVSAAEQPLVDPPAGTRAAPRQPTPPAAPVPAGPVAQGKPASQDVINLFAALQAGDTSPQVAENYRQTLRNLGYQV